MHKGCIGIQIGNTGNQDLVGEKMKQIFSFKKKEKGTEKKPVKKLVLGAVLLAVIAGGAVFVYQKKAASSSKKETSVRTGTVTRQTIQQSLSSSGTISPKNSYTITSMVEGKVISADFNEGDQVTEGQVLYQIDASSMTSKLNSATSSLERAQESYNDAMKDYNSAVADYSGNTVKSTVSGYIKTMKIRAGDQVSGNTEIAEIYNDSVMEVDIPFLSVEAAQISVGSTATLTLSDTLEEISGTVTSVDQLDTTLTGGQLVRYVTVQVTNPGGLTSDMYATASINGINSCGDGAFQPMHLTQARIGASRIWVRARLYLSNIRHRISQNRSISVTFSQQLSEIHFQRFTSTLDMTFSRLITLATGVRSSVSLYVLTRDGVLKRLSKKTL